MLKTSFFASLRHCAFALNRIAFVLHIQRITPEHSPCSCDNCDAADIREQGAALVSFQRHQPKQPPANNVISADIRELPACQFGG